MLALNIVVIFATPIEGGHHWVDVFAAVPVTALCILLARRVFDWTAQMDRARLVAQPVEKRASPAA